MTQRRRSGRSRALPESCWADRALAKLIFLKVSLLPSIELSNRVGDRR